MTVSDAQRAPTLVNLTPHAITLLGARQDVCIPASGTVARVEHRTTNMAGYVHGVPVLTETHPVIMGLPDERPGVYLIVSRAVLTACSRPRRDLLCPGNLVRDENGTVCAARTLVTTSAIAGPPHAVDR